MVKIQDRTLEDKFTREECEEAMQIARRLVGHIPQILPYTPPEFSIGCTKVNMRQLSIVVNTEHFFDEAIKLSQAYESAFKHKLQGKEFTVIRNYD